MNVTVLILACGELFEKEFGWGTRNRFLVPIAGEPLIVRTVRQVEERGFRTIVVTHHGDVQMVVPRHCPLSGTRWFPETLLKTQNLWTDWNVILMGDTVYPDEMLDTILGYRRDTLTMHGKPYGDLDVAVTFPLDKADLVVDACQRAVEGIEARKVEHGPDAWVGNIGPFMRALHHIDLWTTPDKLDYEHYHNIDVGWCMDIDRPEHYKAFLERNPWAR